ILYRYFLFFFFSSRRRHTRSKRDWSSDVCSSDLNETFSSSSTHLLINHVSKICLDFSNCSSDKSKVSSCSILFSRYSRSFSLLIPTDFKSFSLSTGDDESLVFSFENTFFKNSSIISLAVSLHGKQKQMNRPKEHNAQYPIN